MAPFRLFSVFAIEFSYHSRERSQRHISPYDEFFHYATIARSRTVMLRQYAFYHDGSCSCDIFSV